MTADFSPGRLIAVDWGTSRLRAMLVDTEGRILAEAASDEGIGAMAGGHEGAFERLVAEWPQVPAIMAGMVGSRQGWIEAPYLPCPADAAGIAAATVPVALPGGGKAFIVPGLTCRDAAGHPDVLRGEETQLIGLLPALGGEARATVCLPGTHSKWVEIEAGRILGFSTHMTGEMFDLLLNRSMVGRMAAEGAGERDGSAFAAGVARAREADGLLHQLFGIRAAALVGDLPGPAVRPYLSGLLIGHEIFTVAPPSEVHLLGGAGLAAAYAQALAIAGVRTVCHDADLAATGLWRIGAALGSVC